MDGTWGEKLIGLMVPYNSREVWARSNNGTPTSVNWVYFWNTSIKVPNLVHI